MEAAVEELTPLGIVEQPKVLGAWSEVWTYSRAGEVHSNLAGARDVERRAIPESAMPVERILRVASVAAFGDGGNHDWEGDFSKEARCEIERR